MDTLFTASCQTQDSYVAEAILSKLREAQGAVARAMPSSIHPIQRPILAANAQILFHTHLYRTANHIIASILYPDEIWFQAVGEHAKSTHWPLMRPLHACLTDLTSID